MSISHPLNRQPLLLPHRKRAGVYPVPGPGGRLVGLCRHQPRCLWCPGGRGTSRSRCPPSPHPSRHVCRYFRTRQSAPVGRGAGRLGRGEPSQGGL